MAMGIEELNDVKTPEEEVSLGKDVLSDEDLKTVAGGHGGGGYTR